MPLKLCLTDLEVIMGSTVSGCCPKNRTKTVTDDDKTQQTPYDECGLGNCGQWEYMSLTDANIQSPFTSHTTANEAIQPQLEDLAFTRQILPHSFTRWNFKRSQSHNSYRRQYPLLHLLMLGKPVRRYSDLESQ